MSFIKINDFQPNYMQFIAESRVQYFCSCVFETLPDYLYGVEGTDRSKIRCAPLLRLWYTHPPPKLLELSTSRSSMGNEEIAQRIGIHRTTVARILKRFEKSEDLYYVNPKTGCPHKMDICEIRVAARMLAKTEAANATKVVKKAFPEVSHHTLSR